MGRSIAMLLILPVFLMSCGDKDPKISEEKGYLSLNINAGLKGEAQIEEFTLRIRDNSVTILEERIADLPSQIALPANRYTITVFSADFSDPLFEKPVYSGSADVEIVAGIEKEVSLVCSQSNAGVKILWSGDFANKYQTYQAELRCTQGYLTYSATEARTGYFLPGVVSLHVSADGEQLSGGNITLAAKDLAYITLSPQMTQSGALSVSVDIDETVNERNLEIVLEPATSENSETNPYTVAQGITHQDEQAVWVIGYIVGSKPSAGWNFTNPETWQNTNIVIADTPSETSETRCLVVELLVGATRTNLNLLTHPELLHQKIAIKGNLIGYYSHAGLKNITNYAMK